MTDWTPVLIVLALGLVAGGILVFLFGKKGTSPVGLSGEDRSRDLRAKRDALLTQLRDLENEDKRSPEVVAAERYSLELRAAGVLRDLHAEESLQQAPKPAVHPAPPPQQASSLRGFLWGMGSATFLALLLVLVFQFSKDRVEGAPVTGGVPGIDFGTPGTASAQAHQPDPELDTLRLAATQNPGDLNAKLDLAQALLFRDRLIDAWNLIQEVSARAPENARVLTYESVVREAMGQVEKARELLDRAVANEPGLSEAWVRRGIIAFEQEDYREAIKSWETALAQRPDGKDALEPVLAEARRRLEGGTPQRAGGEETVGARMPAGGGAALSETPAPSGGAEPAAAQAADIRITVDLDEKAKGQVSPGSILFVTARASGAVGGPPIAAKRIPVASFPIQLTLGQADSMMGQPFPSSATIEARLDADGNAMTRGPDDPAATAEGVAPGAVLSLQLR